MIYPLLRQLLIEYMYQSNQEAKYFMVNPENKVRKHILVSGRVQGVGFRYTAYYIAQSQGLTGWVKNLDDGRVEMQIQGREDEIAEMLRKLDQGSFIRIESMETSLIPVIPESCFVIAN